MVLFGLIFSAFLGFFFETTSPIIEKSEAEAKRRLLLELISNEIYDNDIEKDFLIIEPNNLLKNKKPTALYLVKYNDKIKLPLLRRVHLMVIQVIFFSWSQSMKKRKF